MSWLEEMFGVKKPVIAMCHLQPMPGDPNYDEKGGMQKVIDLAYQDLRFSMPYLTKVEPVTQACMARIIGELRSEIRVPYGVNCLWDPIASLNVAAAVDGKFIREIISGVYASDFGLWNTNPGETARHRARLGISHVKMLYNIVPEAAKYLADRDIAEIARTTEFNHRPDGICVSGLTAGSATDSQVLKRVKDATAHTPVFCNTGCNRQNVRQQLSIADGAVWMVSSRIRLMKLVSEILWMK